MDSSKKLQYNNLNFETERIYLNKLEIVDSDHNLCLSSRISDLEANEQSEGWSIISQERVNFYDMKRELDVAIAKSSNDPMELPAYFYYFVDHYRSEVP